MNNSSWYRSSTFIPGFMLFLVISLPGSLQAEGYKLKESSESNQTFQVIAQIRVTGKVITAQTGGQASSMKLDANATMKFDERRLPGSGRDAEAYRAIRQYEQAESNVDIHQKVTQIRIRESRKTVIAQGQREGIQFYTPEGPLRYSEIELLNTPGDSLALLPLLPVKEVTVGEEWECSGWVSQMLVGMEAVLKNEFNCKLESVENSKARVSFSGRLEGATVGASSEIDISGHYIFDLEQNCLTHAELVQKEKRSVGAVSPGMEIEATVTVDRKPVGTPSKLNDQIVDQIPLEPEPSNFLLEFQSPWKVRFLYDRNWHIFHQSDQFAVMRLLDKGSLVAQCNLSPISSVAPGNHTPDEVFQNDIRASLKEKLTSIDNAEQIKTDDGRYLYRVTASGTVNDLNLEWVYYLCASPTGQQISFVFSYEKELKEKLQNRDLDLVQNLTFIETNVPKEARNSE